MRDDSNRIVLRWVIYKLVYCSVVEYMQITSRVLYTTVIISGLVTEKSKDERRLSYFNA